MPQVYEIDSAEEFVEFLRPYNNHWLPERLGRTTLTNPTGWIFRGKRSAHYALLPRALRRNALKDYASNWSACPKNASPLVRQRYLARHLLSELVAVEGFLELADEVGIPTPIGYPLRQKISDTKIRLDQWSCRPDLVDPMDLARPMPPPSLVEAFALAQHHGVPTRFLDWTLSPLVAVYFAAKGAWKASKSTKKDNRFAVWALDVRSLGIADGRKRVKTVITSSSNNNYLKSQSGLFLYDDEANRHFMDTGEWPSLEEAIASCWSGSSAKIPLLKITAPWSLADCVLRILFYERITPAHLMPTLDNVADTFLYFQQLFTAPALGERKTLTSDCEYEP